MSPTDQRNPAEAALRIARAFAARNIPYALGGALAYNVWGVPRATVDADLNVFVDIESLDPVFAVLHSLDLAFDEPVARTAARQDGLMIVHDGACRVDLFVPSIDFSWEAAQTICQVRIGDEEVKVLSAEALAVFKLLFFRGKDIVDLERLIGVQQKRLDAAYVRRKIVEMMGEEDERVQRWDELVREHMR